MNDTDTPLAPDVVEDDELTPRQRRALDKMMKPFPDNQVSLLPKPHRKDAEKGHCNVCGGWHGLPAAHLHYVGHAAITLRLYEADPSWSWEPMARDADDLPRFDKSGGLWIRLTVAGITRIGYGNADAKGERADAGTREKEVIGDALRNAAMRFGAALDLWHKGDLFGENNGTGGGDDAFDAERQAQGARGDNPNGLAEHRGPANKPPARKSARAGAAPAPERGPGNKPQGITTGQLKNLQIKARGLDMTEDMIRAMLERLQVPAFDESMSIDDWKRIKAELDEAARA